MCCAPFATAATEDSYVCGKKVDCRIHVYIHTDRQTVRHTDIRIGSATRDLCCVLVHACRAVGKRALPLASSLMPAACWPTGLEKQKEKRCCYNTTFPVGHVRAQGAVFVGLGGGRLLGLLCVCRVV
jgi:hypothetical protein